MKRPNLYDILKVLALVCMIIDHIGYFLYPEVIWLRRVGRIAFPIFLFLVWYNHSYRRRRSLWMWWILVQVVLRVGVERWWGTYGLYKWLVRINILLAIALTRIFLQAVRNVPSWVLGLFLISILLLPYSYELIEYGTMNIIWACIGYRVRGISERRVYSRFTYQIRCRGLLVIGWVGQARLTYAYFWWSQLLTISSVAITVLILWTMTYWNRTVLLNDYPKKTLLFLSSQALPVYAIHILMLYLIQQFLM